MARPTWELHAGQELREYFPEFLHWGCREHFVSGCWHPSGRDCGRYPRECWLSTLGVLHPGVPVMWYGHIRDLSTTAEGCKGGRLPNVTLLHWAKQPRWCEAVMIGWMEVGWEGSPPHTIAHTTRVAHAQVEHFLSLPPWPCSWRDALCSQVCCRGNG